MQPNYSDIIDLVRKAGKAILEIYNRSEYTVIEKEDRSPLTDADLAANDILLEGLVAISSLPIISEEVPAPPLEERSQWPSYWLIDPIDGTKEFIERSGDFCINIALIENGDPVFGMIYSPVTDEAFYGGDGRAFLKVGNEPATLLKPSSMLKRIASGQTIRLISSKRHGLEKVDTLCDRLIDRVTEVEHITVGSALKLAFLASGRVDLYPRYGNVCEWDIAAGHAILKAVGGDILSLQYEPIVYGNKPNLVVSGFFAVAHREFDWRPLLIT